MRHGRRRESDSRPRQTLDPALQEALIQLLSRGAALTGAQIVSAVPKDIAVAPAIRLLQRWGWDLLAERLAGDAFVTIHNTNASLQRSAGRLSLCASLNGPRH